MIVKLLTEHHLEAAEARLSLHLSKCQIVGNLMHRLLIEGNEEKTIINQTHNCPLHMSLTP